MQKSSALDQHIGLPGQGVIAVQPVAPQRRHRRHAGGTRGDDVAFIVADIHAVFRRNTDGLRGVQQRQRMRLALGQGVTTDQHRATLLPAVLRHDQPRQVLGLVGDDAPHGTGRVQRLEHAGDAIEQHGVPADRGFVALQELGNQRIALGRVQFWKRGRHHRPRALGHHRTQLRRIDRCATALGQHRIKRRDEVRRTVEQSAVQVEQHCTRERRGGHGALTAWAR
ncbi:hypothetical protein D3C72_1408730 [compost metagenome]